MTAFTFKIGGRAGAGITSAGLTFAKVATRSGYHIFDYLEYPSLIRGGHNVMQTTVADEPIGATSSATDFLVALNQETVDRHITELSPDGILLYDADEKITVGQLPAGAAALGLPLHSLSKRSSASIAAINTVALGATLYLLGGELKILQDLLSDQFAKKGQKVQQNNIDAAAIGFEYAQDNFAAHVAPRLSKRKKSAPQIVINGNEAAALGSIAAGLQFAAIYPMTPTSQILEVLAPLQEEFGFIYKQPEDEIAAINMAIGASFAGARSMTATSGGGFCLMTEGFGLAGMTETPVVIIVGQRPGPATGLPTWTEQGDLRFVLHAHQGDFPRLVLAPGDVTETFELTRQAFNLADKYQTPVIVLLDKQVCESHQSVPLFSDDKYKIDRGKFTIKANGNYERYALSPDGISRRVPAGSGVHVIANSDEHDSFGYSNEEAAIRHQQVEKRMQKLATCEREDLPAPQLYGPAEADLTIVAWGSNKGAILAALAEHPRVNFLHLTWLNPFPTEAVAKILKGAKRVLNIENNYSGQLAGLIAEKTGLMIEHQLLKYDGRPFYPAEISNKIKELL
ncbi:MAG: 2-oxoacid:acceptor oxidoreductase subunit alpha [Patescibacteria group bacterium]